MSEAEVAAARLEVAKERERERADLLLAAGALTDLLTRGGEPTIDRPRSKVEQDLETGVVTFEVEFPEINPSRPRRYVLTLDLFEPVRNVGADDL